MNPESQSERNIFSDLYALNAHAGLVIPDPKHPTILAGDADGDALEGSGDAAE